MIFNKYMHIERFGTEEVEQIELGECFVFSKIDGTNGSVWLDENKIIQAGSRNRWLSEGNSDNAGFREYIKTQQNILNFLLVNSNYRLVGEWLVPHSLNTYRTDAWRKFYVFDVIDESNETFRYLTYDEYKPLLDEAKIDYIPCIKKITNGTYDDFVKIMNENNYLIEDGKGVGEGIVIKRYDYVNKFGRVTWAKLITSEFKEKHIKEMGTGTLERSLIEKEITDKYITIEFIDKVYNKMILNDGWSSKRIPQLLMTTYYELVKEESWNFVKEFKQPIINYKTLNHFVINKVKELKKELF